MNIVAWMGLNLKRRLHYILVGCAAMLALAGGTLAFSGSIEASTPRFANFARPNFDKAPPPPALDLARRWGLAEIGEFTRLASDEGICREALSAVGVNWVETPAQESEIGCGFESAIGVSGTLASYSVPSTMTCPLAARLYLWEMEVVAPAAEKHLGTTIASIDVMGTFSCRRVAGTAHLSKHSFGEAIDIAGFKTADGRDIPVLRTYRTDSPEGQFLREIRRGACGLFDVTLGPDFNLDHANHFHLDIGGGYACH